MLLETKNNTFTGVLCSIRKIRTYSYILKKFFFLKGSILLKKRKEDKGKSFRLDILQSKRTNNQRK